jgi:deoxyribodipyrimidine photo-lyase
LGALATNEKGLKVYPISLHIFRRDFRLHDNSALIEALKSSKLVIPCFIFDERQIGNNSYRSDNSIQFMTNSLKELDVELRKKKSRLYFFYGIAENIVKQLLNKIDIKAVYINRDYTPFSKARDKEIENICRSLQVDFHCYADALLHEPEELVKPDNQPYTIFTPFCKKALQLQVSSSKKNSHNNYYQQDIPFENREPFEKLLKVNNPHISVKGGRAEALALLKKVKNLSNYEIIRNYPAMNGTTQLSAHNKFGTISIREFYEEVVRNFGTNHSLINELYWRDFFTHIIFNYPHALEGPFKKQYSNITWSKNEKYFMRWREGNTGFPIVDAGMRELNTTGFMHNRARMITASFLIKNLHIDWRLGEKYFAQKLVDYDPAVNNGNWQWVASTGCDAQPYFRIFNPWLQQKKFDPDCTYIKKWVPELNSLSARQIHLSNEIKENYPYPMIDHQIESQKAKAMYKRGIKIQN